MLTFTGSFEGVPVEIRLSPYFRMLNNSSLKQVTPLHRGKMSLQTREGSTLVIVTFLASASLLLIPISEDSIFLYDDKIIAQLGFVFGFVAFTYRQVTAWTIDRKEYNRAGDRYEKRQRRDEYYLYGGVREFLVAFFLLVPTLFWTLVLSNATTTYTIFLAAFYGLVVASIDAVIRWYDKCTH